MQLVHQIRSITTSNIINNINTCFHFEFLPFQLCEFSHPNKTNKKKGFILEVEKQWWTKLKTCDAFFKPLQLWLQTHFILVVPKDIDNGLYPRNKTSNTTYLSLQRWINSSSSSLQPIISSVRFDSLIQTFYKKITNLSSCQYTFAYLEEPKILIQLYKDDVETLTKWINQKWTNDVVYSQRNTILASLSDTFHTSIRSALKHVDYQAFIKVGKKSAKKTILPHIWKAKNTEWEIVYEILTNPDLQENIITTEQPFILCTKWQDMICEQNEIRVFVVNGYVAAISQQCIYHDVGMVLTNEHVHAVQRYVQKMNLTNTAFHTCTMDMWFIMENTNNNNMEIIIHLIEINNPTLWGCAGSGLFHCIEDYALLFNSNNNNEVYTRIIRDDRYNE